MSDSEDDYAAYGTPLDPLDEDAVPRKKPFSLEDVVSKNNRPRFHGAFTGGFSAGYCNTVGSEAGWQPQSFKSSRSQKVETKIQKPEDFMDDEDMGEFGIAPKVLRATSDYASFSNQRKRGRSLPSHGPIPGEPVLKQLLQPARETVGIKLLKAMGWKPGQGVGPRVTKEEKRQQKRDNMKMLKKVYGCSLADNATSSGNSESSSEDEDQEITFAPDDYEPFLCKSKDNVFGIGYSGLDKRSILSNHVDLFKPSSLIMNEKNKKVSITGQAFGVGALEEEDEDIYATEDMSHYDFYLTSESSQNNKEKPITPSKYSNFAGPALEGFVLSTRPFLRKKYFPPPVLPSNFQPVHGVRKSRFEPLPLEKQNSRELNDRKRGLQRHALTSDDRAIIIGDDAGIGESENNERKELLIKASKITENLTPSSSVTNFRPFAGLPEKQIRYEKYLELLKSGNKDEIARLQPLDMTEWQRQHELTEFERANRLASAMSDRFVPASSKIPSKDSEEIQTCEAAAQAKMFGRLTREKCEWKPTSLLCKRFNVPEPHSGTSAPSSSIMKKVVGSKFSVFEFLDAAPHNSREKTDISTEGSINSSETPQITEENTEEGSTEIEKDFATVPKHNFKSSVEADILSSDPPAKIDLFKAVFLSSSEESDSEEDQQPKTTADQSSVTNSNKNSTQLNVGLSKNEPLQKTPAMALNILRNNSPPRGIFANLDLDALNSYTKVTEKVPSGSNVNTAEDEPAASSSGKQDKVGQESENQSVVDSSMYGPSLPRTPIVPVNKSYEMVRPPSKPSISDAISSLFWVEKKVKKSSKEKHRKEHKKSSKHKKHKKHKKY